MMKYTIEGFSQQYAMTLKKEVKQGNKTILKKIDCTDLVILRWFVDFYPNMKKVEVDGVQYAWLTHKKLLEDLPIVDITKRAFIDRMQKLVEFKILTYKLLKEGGTFSLYGFGENYPNMIAAQNEGGMQSNDIGGMQSNDIGGMQSNNIGGMQSNNIGVCSQTTNKDTSIINSSISDSSIRDKEKKERKAGSFDALLDTYSNNDLEVRELLGEWLKVRKAKRAAMTDKAIELNLKKLDKYASDSNMSVKEYLEAVIMRGWNAFFVINDFSNNTQPQQAKKDEDDTNNVFINLLKKGQVNDYE